MEAKIIDLRYKINEVLKALERNEKVVVTYRGKTKGIIHPELNSMYKVIEDHPFFGMLRDDHTPVNEIMERLRGIRF